MSGTLGVAGIGEGAKEDVEGENGRRVEGVEETESIVQVAGVGESGEFEKGGEGVGVAGESRAEDVAMDLLETRG